MIFDPVKIGTEPTRALMLELSKWRDTPYRPNHRMPGVGVDCVRFVVAVYDSLYGLSTDLNDLPPDTALHDPEYAKAFLRSMARRFGAKKVKDSTIEPGDAVVFAYPHGGPTHVTIAGQYPYYYHADMDHGVVAAGFDGGKLKYHGHYRLPNKSTWAV